VTACVSDSFLIHDYVCIINFHIIIIIINIIIIIIVIGLHEVGSGVCTV